jgi:hypothetical protein
LFGVQLPAPRVVERVDPLTLEPDELVLLDLLGPPLLVNTPRAVKRLANSYGLLTAIRRPHREADLSEQRAEIRDLAAGGARAVAYHPYRAGMVLLAALVAFPALGPALFLRLHHAAAEHPHQTRAQFLETLQPRQRQSRWWNPADPDMTPVQAQRWQALLHGLHRAARAACDHDPPLTLPEPLTAWADWVVPVGRLSFPTGRIVSTLDRQAPLRLASINRRQDPRRRHTLRMEDSQDTSKSAAALGKLGGSKGGRARASRLTPAERSLAATRSGRSPVGHQDRGRHP